MTMLSHLLLVPVTRVGEHDLGPLGHAGVRRARGVPPRRSVEVTEVRAVDRDLGRDDDLPARDRRLRVVALDRRLPWVRIIRES